MADTLGAVAKAVYDQLVAGFQPIGIPVFDDPPPDQDHPFVEVGRQIAETDDTHTEEGDEVLLFISCWSEHRGKGDALAMLEVVRKQLHNANLALATGSAISCRVLDRRADRDADGHTYMGSATVRVLTDFEF